MKANAVLACLEQECRERGVKLIYDDLQSEGGFCRLKDKHYVIINRRAAVETRIRILRDALDRVPEFVQQPLPSSVRPDVDSLVPEGVRVDSKSG